MKALAATVKNHHVIGFDLKPIHQPRRKLSGLLQGFVDVAFNGTERSVDVMVSRLRRKLEPSDDSPSIIKTVRGVGYMFSSD